MTTETGTETAKRTRREWIDQAKAKLDDWDEAMNELEAKAARMKLQAKSGVRAQLDATKRSLEEARASWSKVAEEANDVWEAVSDEIGAAWDANKAAFERSLEELRSALD